MHQNHHSCPKVTVYAADPDPYANPHEAEKPLFELLADVFEQGCDAMDDGQFLGGRESNPWRQPC